MYFCLFIIISIYIQPAAKVFKILYTFYLLHLAKDVYFVIEILGPLRQLANININ